MPRIDELDEISATCEDGKTLPQGAYRDLALHTIGWKAFQDLCAQVCEEEFQTPVEIFREAHDGGQDAVFLIPSNDNDVSPVGTVQCKHTSTSNKSLVASDLNPEIENVKTLVKEGQADTYLFITNMNVDATVALEMRKTLQGLGVKKPYIFGKHKLVQIIKGSSRLRALVPQVYGLGDLSVIIDERAVEQTKLLLAHWLPKLKAYVATTAHSRAVRALEEHSAVLLLGNASTGKSTIGAILSTIAAEDPEHTVLKLTSPREFDERWNAHDRKRFFWIDDAFGSNTMRADYVNDWSSLFSKVQSAIASGNRFLFTSRRHIYLAAKSALGQRNLPMFIDETAVVNVGQLSTSEKAQILYNHIKFGDQDVRWKRRAKPHFKAVASVNEFLPGIAERLGKQAFTKTVYLNETALTRFMSEPREHLMDTIKVLDGTLRAALILVYVHRGALILESTNPSALEAVTKITDVSFAEICQKLPELDGSFLKSNSQNGQTTWSFEHPTIADALTGILGDQPHMLEALLRGAEIGTILESFQCAGMKPIQDAAVVPSSLNGVLKDRLISTPDEHARNWALFSFLADRASDELFADVVGAASFILERKAWTASRISSDPKINTHARAFRLGLLPEEIREETALRLETMAIDDFDLSFCEYDELLSLIPARRLLALGDRIRRYLDLNGTSLVSEIAGSADIDEDPESHFEHVSEGLRILEFIAPYDDPLDSRHTEIHEAIQIEIEILSDEQEKARAKEENETDWGFASVRERNDPKIEPSDDSSPPTRSVYDDVDL